MKTSLHLVSGLLSGAAVVALAFAGSNCSPSGGSLGGSSGNGSGGFTSSGSGGNSGSNGGNNGNGGSVASNGGRSSNGGSNTNGGSSASNGGSNTNGGSSASNGGSTPSNGGSVASNGGSTPSNGGAPASNGGSTTASSTPTGKTVTFASGKGVGAMVGYGWVALGSEDAVTDPTCGATKAAITQAAPCTTTTNWSSTSSLCMTGSIPVVSGPTDYGPNWGVSVGVNATDPPGSGLGQNLTSVAITVTGAPTSGLRAVVHRKGDTDQVTYCAALTSGAAITLTSFVTDCYDTPATGTTITTADIPNIDKISVQVSSGTAAAITVTNLCLTGITFQ
jgi:hypothetical protein